MAPHFTFQLILLSWVLLAQWFSNGWPPRMAGNFGSRSAVPTWERKRCYWHPVSGGQGRCSTSYSTWGRPQSKELSARECLQGRLCFRNYPETRIQAHVVHLRGDSRAPQRGVGSQAGKGRNKELIIKPTTRLWATVAQSHWGTLESSEERGPQSYPSRGLRELGSFIHQSHKLSGNTACRGH